MRLRSKGLLAVLWVGSIVISIYLGGVLAKAGAPPALSGPPEALDAVPALEQAPEDAAALRQENQTLRERLAQLEAERSSLGRDYLQLAIKQSMESAAGASAPSGDIRTYWDKTLEDLFSRGGGMLGRLDKTIALLLEMASYGEPGIRFLGGVANDKTRSAQERETALQALAYLHHRAAFEILLDFRDDTLTELDYPYDLIRGQVATLPTADIAARIPDMLAQIDADLGTDNYSPERPEVLLFLAAVHNNASAQQLLYDERMWSENAAGAIQAAAGLHNQAAWDFLRAVEANHQDARSRESAANALDAW